MIAYRFSSFAGLMPKVASRLLPDANGQVASNVKLQSGNMVPLRGTKTITAPTKPKPALSIYKAVYGASTAWLTWPFDVDVVRSPLPTDVEPRFYWTGDGEPRYGTFTNVTNGGGNNYPALYYALGVPNPVTAPTVTPSGGVGSTVTRYYCYTFFSALGEESGPSKVSASNTNKVDATWAISGMDAFPISSGTGTAAYNAGTGLTTFTAAATHWLRQYDQVVLNSTTLVVQSVSGLTFTVLGDYHTATTWARAAAWNTSGMKRRLYRTSGSLGTFQLVYDDIEAHANWNSVTKTFSDTLTDAQIMGDQLISSGWNPPPANLSGLAVHSSGCLVGFHGNQLCASVPFQPHAWVNAYSLSTDYDIVGIATYGSEIAVGTKGNPYIASGADPSLFTMDKKSGFYPCLSKRSVHGTGDGAVYASAHGLVYMNAGQVNIASEDLFTKDEWAQYYPASMVVAAAYGRLYIETYDGARYKMLIMDSGILTTADVDAYELFPDPITGTLYVSTVNGVDEWDSTNAYVLNASWKSKRIVNPNPVNFGVAKVEFVQAIDPTVRAVILAQIASVTASNTATLATGNAHGAFNARQLNVKQVDGSDMLSPLDNPPSNNITFILYSEGNPVFSKVISDNKPFRLPAGFKTNDLEIQVNSQCSINEIRIAETMTGLKIV